MLGLHRACRSGSTVADSIGNHMTRTAASVAVLSFALGCGVDANPRGSQGGPGADVQTIEDGALECAPAWETPWVGGVAVRR